jgi:hypothetical protein
MALSYSTATRNSRLDAIVTAVGASGLVRIYDGTRPANPGTAITTQVLLAELTCSATFGTSSAGVLTVSAITQDSSANNTGTASWFRVTTSGGTGVIDGNVSTSGSDLNLTTTSITTGQSVSITSFTITEGNA